jgi:hypothetical protein
MRFISKLREVIIGFLGWILLGNVAAFAGYSLFMDSARNNFLESHLGVVLGIIGALVWILPIILSIYWRRSNRVWYSIGMIVAEGVSLATGLFVVLSRFGFDTEPGLLFAIIFVPMPLNLLFLFFGY